MQALSSVPKLLLSTIVEDINSLSRHSAKNKSFGQSSSSSSTLQKSSVIAHDDKEPWYHLSLPRFPQSKYFTERYWQKNNPHDTDSKSADQDRDNPKKQRASEHAGYDHLSVIWVTLNELEHHVSFWVKSYFMWGYAFFATLAILSILVFLFYIVMLLFISSNTGLTVWEIVATPNPLLWLSITYMDPIMFPGWVTLIVCTFVALIMVNYFYMNYLQMEERKLIVHAAAHEHVQENEHHKAKELSNPFQPFTRSKPVQLEMVSIDQAPAPAPATKHDIDEDKEYVEDVQLAQEYTDRGKYITQRRRGIAISAFIFIGLLLIQFLFGFYFFVINDYQYSLYTGSILTGALVAINFAWKAIARQATKLECHTNLASYYQSLLIKNYVFRYMSTIITLCISQLQIFLVYSAPSTDSIVLLGVSSLPETSCRFVILTEQYFFLTLSEIGQSILLGIIIPEVQRRYVFPCYKNSSVTMNEQRLEFEAWSEYLDLTYKEFLIMLGVGTFPGIVIGMAVAVFIELRCDIVKLLRYSQPVIMSRETFIDLRIFVFVLNIILALALVPNGEIFIIMGFANNCQLLL